MAKESKYEGSEHESACDLARRLCDQMHDCISTEYAPRKHFTERTCGAYVTGRKASLYWLYHYNNHVRVFLYGRHLVDISNEIQRMMPFNVKLQIRQHIKTDRVKDTACYFSIHTEEQARSMGPLLHYLTSIRSNSSRDIQSAKSDLWHPLSEVGDIEIFPAQEGERKIALINKYERSIINRESCIRANGTSCVVCGFDFPSIYGSIGYSSNGKGYIHVHHLNPLAASKGKSRRPDPINELKPVCPNCHEMLHRGDPLHPKTIEQLKEIIAKVKASNLRLQSPNTEA